MGDPIASVLQTLFPADENLTPLVSAVRHDKDLPLVLGRKLEVDVRVLLRDTGRASLFDLITALDEAEILSDGGVALAHLLRKERNRSAHGEISAMSAAAILARNLMCVCAFRLLTTEIAAARR